MHDLVHDLAQVVSGETIFRLEEVNKQSRRFERARHSSYSPDEFDGKSKFEVLYEVEFEHLRTFLPVRIRKHVHVSYITGVVLHDLLSKFKKLRVLSLQGYRITQLPNSIKDLSFLKYLNLAGTEIRSLPESTSSLFNLQILILRGCFHLTKLPSKMRNLINLCHLDIKGAYLLENMPLGMKQLKNLHTLSNFIVGKDDSVSSLKDLKHLKFLRGELHISGLDNLNDSRDAREAALWEKQNLEALSLEWGYHFDNSRDEVVEKNVLTSLQPHRNIKELAISYYGGLEFPIWIGNGSLSKMEVLTLENFGNCKTLPSLGLLSSLKHLTIKGLMKLESINSGFCGNGCSKPFQSLETLRFENLPELKYWDTNIKENEPVEFSSLRELSIVRCQNLSGKLPELLPSLEKLVVSVCPKLVVSFSSYQMLCKLKIDKCKEMVCSNSPIDSKLINCMTISSSSLDISGCKGMLYNSPPELLRFVTISNILDFGKFLKQGFEPVDSLRIGSSQDIEVRAFYLRKAKQGFSMLANHDEVSMGENCIRLVPFPEFKFLPSNLRFLKIENNVALKSLPEEMMGNNSQLETLHVIGCLSLTFIAKGKMPSSLISLEIINCQNLLHLVDGEEYAAAATSSSSSSMTLKVLFISGCAKLTTLSSGVQLLKELESLHISYCQNFESLPDGLHSLTCLKKISICNCPKLVCFPEGGLPSTISDVSIHDCENLEALPNDVHKLYSLQHLTMTRCPSIVSFPEAGFFTGLASLVIKDIKICKAVIQWGLHRLAYLRSLMIDGRLESFPDEEIDGMMLPTSLTHLEISGFRKLKCLSSTGFQSLTSLESLQIGFCPELKSFGKVNPPSSLMKLEIYSCPLLKEQCKRDRGKEWSKIAHIPFVEIDFKFIYD